MAEVTASGLEIVKPRIVVVTGGNGGIGRATSERFAANGYQVVATGRNPDTLAEVDELEGVTSVRMDVSNHDEVRARIGEIAEEHGQIDVLVNAAGSAEPVFSTFDAMEADAVVGYFDRMITVNLMGTVAVTKAVLPHMPRPGASIINVTSEVASSGGILSSGFAAAKGAVNSLTRALANELAPEGVTVNAVAPGYIEGTGATDPMGPDVARMIAEQTPLKRNGRPAEVASAIFNLAGAKFTTGQIMHVNGGTYFGC